MALLIGAFCGFHINFRVVLYVSFHEYFDKIFIDSVNRLIYVAILTVLIFPVQECEMSFHIFLFQFLFTRALKYLF